MRWYLGRLEIIPSRPSPHSATIRCIIEDRFASAHFRSPSGRMATSSGNMKLARGPAIKYTPES